MSFLDSIIIAPSTSIYSWAAFISYSSAEMATTAITIPIPIPIPIAFGIGRITIPILSTFLRIS